MVNLETWNGAGPWILLLAGCLSALAALAHVGIVLGGPAWYRFFGAGERMAQMAARGSWHPAIVTLGIAVVLAIWSAYAFSAAGALPAFPFLRFVLLAVTAVYLLRGLVGLAVASRAPGGNSTRFWVCSSLICIALGIVHAVGLGLHWEWLPGAGG